MPPGGWMFFEPTTKITLMANTRENLVKHLISHRKSNALPEGNPEQEIDDQILSKYPEIAIQ